MFQWRAQGNVEKAPFQIYLSAAFASNPNFFEWLNTTRRWHEYFKFLCIIELSETLTETKT